MAFRVAWLVAVLFLLHCIFAIRADDDIYSAESPIAMLNDATWEQVVRYGGVSSVEFYIPQCKYCQLFAPRYLQVANTLKGLALVGAVNCADKASAKICRMENIQGFPTVKIYAPEATTNPYTGQLTKEGEQLPALSTSGYTSKQVYNAITSLYNDSLIQQISTDSQRQQLIATTPEVPKVVLYTNKSESSLLYNSLSYQYKGYYQFALVHDSAAEVLSLANITTTPALLLYTSNATTTYDGPLKQEQLHQFLLQHKPETRKDVGTGSAGTGSRQQGKTAAAVPVYNATAAKVEELNNALEMVLLGVINNSDGDACSDQVASFTSAADLGKDQYCRALLLNASAADEAALSKLAALGVDLAALQQQPCNVQVLLLPFGADKEGLDGSKLYSGALESSALKDFVLQHLPDLTTRLEAREEIDEFVQSAHPDDSSVVVSPKVILVTTKSEVPGVFKALAMALRAHTWVTAAVAEAASEAGEALLAQMQGRRPPKILSMVPVPLPPEQAPQHTPPGQQAIGLRTEMYQGPVRFQQMESYFLRMAAMYGFARQQRQQQQEEGGSSRGSGRLVAVDSNEAFDQACVKAGGLCQISFLDPAAEGYAAIKGMLQKLASERSSDPVTFLEVDAKRQASFASEFGVSLSQLPQGVVYSPKKKAFVAVSGGLDSSSISSALRDALAGRARPAFLQEHPQLVEGGEQTEVQAEVVVEEEFDLSDVMSEDVDTGLLSKEEQMRQIEEQIKAEQEAAAKKAAAKKKKKSKKKKRKGKKAIEGAAAKDEL